MAAKVSHKLTNALEGALAGGGDPATSPLYVFGPFLRLIVVAGVAKVTFGASIWLVVLTIASVSAMYRLVMGWVTDGSGGSGLNEDEFGRWAVKINAAITFIEYTLTFLVSMAAMVTFIADRIPVLNDRVLGIQYRTFVAILLSILTGWLVNRGPRTASRAFGPATAGVLFLLWAMIIATVARYGIQLPDLNLQAFGSEFLTFTFGGYARILAVMTGIEVFANLVPAYSGSEEEKSSKAFNSLMIIMGTTVVTMIIVGPAILNLSNPTNEEVSVFTQTMDILLPTPLPIIGTLVGVAVLLSASAASAQGLQNLALGLKDRNYIPDTLGRQNRFEVADKPVWIEVGIVSVTFLLFGTSEETYLAIYAAGVFILLSMTGWAAAKRLFRELRESFQVSRLLIIAGTVLAATMTTAATVVIFEERFFEGAWTYFIFIPVLYAVFTYFRNSLGEPSPMAERLGQLEEAMREGFGFGQAPLAEGVPQQAEARAARISMEMPSVDWLQAWRTNGLQPRRILVPLDGSSFAEQALPLAELFCQANGAQLTMLSALPLEDGSEHPQYQAERAERLAYLQGVAERLEVDGIQASYQVLPGSIAESTSSLVDQQDIDLIVTSTRGRSGVQHWLSGGVARKIINRVNKPVLLIQRAPGSNGAAPRIRKVLVTLDGSSFSARILPYAEMIASTFNSEVLLLSVPEVPEAERYGPMADLVVEMREQAEVAARDYLERVAENLRTEERVVRVLVQGSNPARTIFGVSEEEGVDLILMATRGRGGLDRLLMGSVAERVVQRTTRPVLLLPVHEGAEPAKDL